ncbi:MAG: hypothetical protein J6J23_00195 [Clostridia bacterium]|nr:hypothetical protein [Clostridia bacterium]
MAVKTFPYAVVWNGEIVPRNTPIEVIEEVKKDTTSEKEKQSKKKGVK